MPEGEVSEELRTAFLEGLDLPSDTNVTTLTFGAHPHWDSLGHMTLVEAIEQRFDITLGGQAILRMDTFGASLDIVTEALRDKNSVSVD